MKSLVLVAALVLTGTAAQAFFITTTPMSLPTYTTDASSGNDSKYIIDAQDDASSFVASGGAIRGVHLTSALDKIRRDNPGLEATDEQLANAILVYGK